MEFINFASSSAGNCYWVELERSNQNPVKLMLEAGISYKEIVKKTVESKKNISDLDAVIVTHSHQDHCKAVKDLRDRGFRVYGNTFVCSSLDTLLADRVTKVVAPDTYVIPFLVEHDAPDPFGYIIYTDKEKILFVADSKYWKADLSYIAFDYVIIEANYDGRVIHFALEEAKKNYDYAMESQYERVLQAHMSINNCCKQLKKLDLSKCKAIFLIHLSDRHANENEFKKKVQATTKIKNCFICKKTGGIF